MIINLLNKFFLHLKLRRKLLLSYFLLIIIPLGIFTLASYSSVNKIMKEHIIFSANHAFDQASEFIFYKINKVIKVSDIITLDNTMNSTLEKKLDTYTLPDQYKDMNDLRNYLESFTDELDGMEVKLYVSDDLVYSRGNFTLFGFSDAKKYKWYTKLNESSNKILMCPSVYLEDKNIKRSDTLSLVRKLKQSSDFRITLAYLQIDFREEDIQKILSDANTTRRTLTYLENSSGIIVSSTDNNLLSKFQVDLSENSEIIGKDDWTTMSFDKEQAFVKARVVPNTDWNIVTVIPIKDIYENINTLKKLMFLLLLVIGTIAYLAAVYISISISKRIDRLMKRMKSIQNGNFENATILVDSTDEIGQLTQDYNYMIQRIIDLVDEKYKAGQQLKNAELRTLQAQINPHFLYNTLDMINWMSYEDKGAEMRSIIKSLSSFYKISLNNGKYIVSINDELIHVGLYIQIQKVRLNNRIEFIIDVDESIREHSIIKITLQPIIENAILHGVMEKEEKQGKIIVHAEIVDEVILITVTDDGIGITPDQIRDIFSDNGLKKQNHGHGFSIRNIHERIQIYFGSEYGLSIKNNNGNGTIVSIRLPIIKKDN